MYEVINIQWIRANIVIELNKKIVSKVFLINEKSEKLQLESYQNKIKISLTNVPDGSMIESGCWHLEIDNTEIKINKNLVKSLDDFSRIFKYRKGFYTFLVDFSIDLKNSLYINTDYMMKNRKYKKYFRIIEGETPKAKFIIFIKKTVIFLMNLLYKFINLFKHSKKQKVLFLTENSTELDGNLKKLYNKFENEDGIKLKMYAFNRATEKTFINLIKEYVYLCISDIIIIDNYVSMLNLINFSKKTKIIQLWHAGIGFKAVGYARFGKKGSPHPFESGHRKYTKVLVDDEKFVDIYKEVFGVKKEIFDVCRMPRLENYLSPKQKEETIKKIYKENESLKNKKVILFSPTYRGDVAASAYYDYSKIDLKQVYNFCYKNNFAFIIKMHPFIKEQIIIPDEYKEFIFNYNNYNINDLIYISDVMITDYSSCAYEFSLFEKPLIFYRYDKEFYEYNRPIHTLDIFSKEQYEVYNFSEVIEILNKIKDKLLEGKINSKNINKKVKKISLKNILGE